MRISLLAALALALVFFAAFVSSQMKIEVDIKETAMGIPAAPNFSSWPVQKFRIYWQNTGSVPCSVRMRVDYYSGEERNYTAWSARKELLPGKGSSLVAYADLEPGNYTYRVRVYSCNEIYPVEIRNNSFAAEYRTPENSTLELAGMETFDGFVRVYVKSRKDTGNILVFPTKFPLGWTMDYGFIESIRANEIKTADISYEPSVFKDTPVEIEAASLDGKSAVRKHFLIRKKTFDFLGAAKLTAFASLAGIILIIARRRSK
jgi:hypothetical protein